VIAAISAGTTKTAGLGPTDLLKAVVSTVGCHATPPVTLLTVDLPLGNSTAREMHDCMLPFSAWGIILTPPLKKIKLHFPAIPLSFSRDNSNFTNI
jgi:hypothetical protein